MSGGITTDQNDDVVDDRIKIEGGTDDTPIGNIADRLKVDALISSAPSTRVIYFDLNATDSGGSPDMDVDGSSVNVEFTVGPPAGEIWYVFEFGINIEDSGNNTVDRYGAINGGLTNGTLIEQHIDGADYEFRTFKNNLELVETFSDHSFRGQANAFLNSANFYAGKVELREPITLIGDDGDEIHVHVRDDLTGLDQHRFAVEGFRII